MIVVVMAGLPGTGKTAVSTALAQRLRAPRLDKDRLRAALFGPEHVTYTSEQDDFCCELLYRTVEHLEDGDPARIVVLDGRTYSRRVQVDALIASLARPGRELFMIECRAPAAVARRRLTHDAERGLHAARNRDVELYDRLASNAEPIAYPTLVLETAGASLDTLVGRCLEYIHAPA